MKKHTMLLGLNTSSLIILIILAHIFEIVRPESRTALVPYPDLGKDIPMALTMLYNECRELTKMSNYASHSIYQIAGLSWIICFALNLINLFYLSGKKKTDKIESQ